MKRALRIAVIAAIVAAPVLMSTASATAADRTGLIDCTSPPTPQDPRAGVPATLDTGPLHPRPGDPFAARADTTIYEQYGWAGAQWPNYDLGCGPDAARDLNDSAWSVMATGSLSTLTATSSAVVAVTRLGFEPQRITGALDPIGHVMQDSVGGTLLPRLIGPAIAVAGITLLIRHRRTSPRQAAEHAGWAGVVLVAAVAATAWALTLGPLVDRTVTLALNVAAGASGQQSPDSTSQSGAGDALGGSMQQSVVYRVWLAGMLGSADSPTARTYGPRLWRASALSRGESQQIAEDPSKAAGIQDAKQQAFRDAASRVKDVDPAAYAYLSGHQNFDRWAYSLLGWVALAAVAPLALVAALLLLWGMTVVRITLWLIPVIAIGAVIPRYRPLLTRAVSYAVSSLVTAVVFGSVTLLWIGVVGVVIAPGSGQNPVAVLLVLGAAQVALVRILHPWRRIRPVAAPVGRFAVDTAGAVRDGWHDASPDNMQEPQGSADTAVVQPEAPTTGPGPAPAAGGSSVKGVAAGIAVTAAAAAVTGGASAAATAAKAAASRAVVGAAVHHATSAPPAAAPSPGPRPAGPAIPAQRTAPPAPAGAGGEPAPAPAAESSTEPIPAGEASDGAWAIFRPGAQK